MNINQKMKADFFCTPTKVVLLSMLLLFSFKNLGKAQTLTIDFITTMPVCVDGDFQISFIEITGLPNGCSYGSPTYEWQRNSGQGWNFLTDGGPFNGVDSPVLSVQGVPASFDNDQYRLIVTLVSTVTGCDPIITVTSNVLISEVESGVIVQPLSNIVVQPENGTLCPGLPYTLSAMPNNNVEQIFWYDSDPANGEQPINSAGTGSIMVTQSGTYYALRMGCNSTDPVSIDVNYLVQSTAPTTITVEPSLSICPGESITLTASGGVAGTGSMLVWYLNPSGGGMALHTGPSLTVSPLSTTDYYVRREQGCGTPTSDLSEKIQVKAIPSVLTDIFSSPPEPCIGEFITLNASGNDIQPWETIVWYDGPGGTGTELETGSTLIINSAENATYYARIENGCPGGNSADTSIAIIPKPSPVADFAQLPDVTCIGEPVTFEALESSEIIEYTWSFSGGDPSSFSGKGPVEVTFGSLGQRTVKLTVDNGSCESTSTVSVQVFNQPSIFVNDIPIGNGMQTFTVTERLATSLELSSNLTDATFEWNCTEQFPGSIENGALSGTGDQINQNWRLAEGEEEAGLDCMVTVTQGNCTNTSDFQLIIKQLIFIPNVITANGDSFNECWDIKLGPDTGYSPSDFEIKLYSRGGKCLRGCKDTFTVADAVEWCGEDCPAAPMWYVITGPDGFEATGSLTLIK